MKSSRGLGSIAVLAVVIVVGCLSTRSEVEVKPIDINLNISGRLELVITDARRQEEQIAGGRPKRTVRPEDIGLPALAPALPPAKDGGPGASRSGADGFWALLVSTAQAGEGAAESEAALVQSMAARHGQVAALLDGKSAGESHTGLVAPRTSLGASQQALIAAENADRSALYRLVAARQKTDVAEVALGYYLARLEHVEKGTWTERFDKAKGTWVWIQWDR